MQRRETKLQTIEANMLTSGMDLNFLKIDSLSSDVDDHLVSVSSA